MNANRLLPWHDRRPQFGVRALVEYVTMCGVALVTVQTWGIWPSIFLMGLALALTLSQGGFSIGMLICALIAADARGGPTSTTAGGCQLICVAVAAVLCGWCWLRTKLVKPAP